MNVGSQALLAHQQAINVTGYNISNVDTPGYTRQRLKLEPNVPLQSGIGPMGTGVRAVEVARIYDRFLGVQINTENQDLGRWTAQKSALEKIEMVFDETDGYGLNQALSEFWNAWQDLANNPSGRTERTVLSVKGQILADTFNKKYTDLVKTQQDIDESIRSSVDTINRSAEQIADLNQKIMQLEAGGHSANDYRDQRDLALKNLAEIIDFDAFEDNTGMVHVAVGDGKNLVNGSFAQHLTTQPNANGLQDIYWVDPGGGSLNITAGISGGKIKGWLEARDVNIADDLNRLDDLAQTLIGEVNILHAAGFALDSSSGNNFFAGTSAGDIAVDPALVSDVNLIAAASNLAGVPGDSSNAVAIADLQNKLTMSGNTATFDDFFNALVSDVGQNLQQAAAYESHQSEMVHQLENYRESISGVSIDEEMVNLVKSQHAYDAAAKLISTADELLQTVLNMV